MNILECLDLIANIKGSQKDNKTAIGACYSMQNEYLGKKGIVNIGAVNGKPALYARSKTLKIPSEWCGFQVINTGANIWDQQPMSYLLIL